MRLPTTGSNDEIIESELNSIKSDYHICKDCLQLGDNFEKEF